MERLLAYIEQHLDEQLRHLILSNPRKKQELTKIKIKTIKVKDQIVFQRTEYVGTKVLHENLTKDEVLRYVEQMMMEQMKQIECVTSSQMMTGLVSKKGTVTMKVKNVKSVPVATLDHNRKKQRILEEGIAVPFLVDLGVMTKEGLIKQKRFDKFKQMNRFLEFVEDILPQLPTDRELTIIDFGCGKSYLTFALYYYLHELKKYPIRMIGLDLKKDVMEHCNELAQKYGYDQLTFLVGDIKDYEGVNQVDMVVTLHACDTATDYALAKAVEWQAKVILSVPCCQHEINGQMKSELLEPVLRYGILKERMAALITDGVRAELLEQAGYKTQILEFIDMEHTPKNLLIRGVKTGKKTVSSKRQKSYETMCESLQIQPTLQRILEEEQE